MNLLYPKVKAKFLDGGINWTSDTIKCVCVNASIYNSSHEFLSDITSGYRITTATLSGKTSTNGIADANDITIANIASGNTVIALILYKDTGVEGTSPLILYMDLGSGLPLVANDGGVTIQWSNDTNKIFVLAA